MGLHRQTNKPCGFCFVEFATREQASRAVDLFNCSAVDNKKIRVDWDYGYVPERQFGRGPFGAQVRDDRRARDGLHKDEDRPIEVPEKDTNIAFPTINRGGLL